jgi:phosphoribosylformylglycinamidine synthase
MADRIEVGFKEGIRDALGEKTKKRIIDNLALPVDKVATIEVYTIAGELTASELKEAAAGPLSDPVIQEFSINKPLAKHFDWLIEVGFRPGVTDNVGKTAREAITLLLGENIGAREVAVYTSRQYFISGQISKADAEKIASGLLANDLTERHQVIAASNFDFSCGMPAHVPQVLGKDEPQVEEINLTAYDADALTKISQVKLLALNLEEMEAIQRYYKNPVVIKARGKVGLNENTTDVELECLAQTWSEHCKHKIFNSKIDYTDGRNKLKIDSLFKKYIKGSTAKIRKAKGKKDFCLSVFVDNAGVIKFNNDHNLVFKVETHNSPSALDPYGHCRRQPRPVRHGYRRKTYF